MRTFAALLVLLAVIRPSASAQAGASCPVAPAALSSTAPNIFNVRQEQDLGDAYAEIDDAHLRFINDPAAEAYLDKIGQKLLAVLPPNEFHFRYKIVDSPLVNAWSIAGGHIYFTRKLISVAANEDQIAAVMAHEIGHALIHQQAIETTADWNAVLHVTSVGDRADIFDKMQRRRNAERPWGRRAEGQRDEKIADAIGVFAVTKAGYMPGAYADFWDLTSHTQGKTGSALGVIFGTVWPNQERLRTMRKNIAAIPAGCVTATHVSVPAEFVAWRDRVAADPTGVSAADADDKATQLIQPLRSDLTRLRYSPDGKFALAQDRFSVFVLGRSLLRLLFQIDAQDADPASFSPDSSRISFSTPSLRVEEWDVASQQPLGAHDVLAYRPCYLHLLSPDGHVMACILNTGPSKPQLGLALWDVDTGNAIVQKDNFGTDPSKGDIYTWWVDIRLRWPLVRWAFTPDSKRLMVNREPTTLIYDLDRHSFAKAGGALAKLGRKPFAMLGNDRIVIDEWDLPKKSAVYSFPDGKELHRIPMGSQELRNVTRGDYLILNSVSVKDATIGVLDLGTGQMPFTMSNDALDIYDKTVLMESAEGGVTLTSQGLVPGATDSESLDLPLSGLGEISAAAFSADGKFLALSNKSRCAIWNAESGERLFSMRPFSGGYFDEADRFYGDFPKYRGQDHVQVVIDPLQRKATKLAYSVDDHAEQDADVLLNFKGWNLNHNIHQKADFEVREVKTNRVLWTVHSLEWEPFLATEAGSSEMVMSFDAMFDDPAQHELKTHPELMAEPKALKDPMHGLLVEVLDKQSGAYLRGVVADVPHGRSYFGSNIPLRARAFGDFALIESNHNSAVVYRFSNGQRLGAVFGEVLAWDTASGLFCVRNSANDLVVYDAATVRERKHFTFTSSVRFAQFLPARKELMVLTADQKIHAIGTDDLHVDTLSTQTELAAAVP